MDLIEYKVRPVIRFVVTRFESSGANFQSGSNGLGEFDNFDAALSVANALCTQDQTRLGYAIDDERIQFPKDKTAEECIASAERDRLKAVAAWEQFKNSAEFKNQKLPSEH